MSQGHFRSSTSPGATRSRRRARRKLLLRRTFIVGLLLLVSGGLLGTLLEKFKSKTPAAAALWHLTNARHCDVMVIGATPSGVAAAIAAARQGAQVVLVEPRPKVGGDITYAFLNMFDVPVKGIHSDKSPVDYGIFGEFYHQLGIAFDLDTAQSLFQSKIDAEPNIHLLLSTKVKRLQMRQGRLQGALLKLADGTEEGWTADNFVDATNDADIAARAGASYTLGRETANPDHKMQAAGLLFEVSGVRWSQVSNYVRRKKVIPLDQLERFKHGISKAIDVRVEGKDAVLRLGGGTGNYMWERGDIVKGYVPQGPDVMMLSINFGRQSDGTVILNTLNLLNVNGLDPKSRQHAIAEGRAEIPRFLEYLRANMPGFKKAQLKAVAPELYIRETRHIRGYHTLTMEYVRGQEEPRNSPDRDPNNERISERIALCSYPLDLHPYVRGELNKLGPKRYEYALPLGTLIVHKVDGIFLASRSLSATYSAAGSARVIPVTMAAGEAVGVAAALCSEQHISPHELAASAFQITTVQDRLRTAGVNIGDEVAGIDANLGL